MGAKIVAIDGDRIFLRILENAFRNKEYEFLGISTGNEALGPQLVERLEEGVSLIILERLLPDMDGMKVLDYLFEKYRRSVPIVVLSTLSSDRDILESLKHGAVYHLSKPVALKVLIMQMHALILWQEQKLKESAELNYIQLMR